MKEVKGAKGRQLKRDLELTQGSADAILDVTEAMEATRNSLRSYSKNVGYFKVSLTLSNYCERPFRVISHSLLRSLLTPDGTLARLESSAITSRTMN